MRYLSGVGVVLISLACAGGGSVVGYSQEAQALRQTDGGCEYITWSRATGESVSLQPGACPEQQISPVRCPQDCALLVHQDRVALQALYAAGEPGFLSADMEGWLFGLVTDAQGVTHVQEPLFTCKNSDCVERIELRELPEGDLQLSGYEDFLLVIGSHETRVYQSESAEPVYVFAGAQARWLL